MNFCGQLQGKDRREYVLVIDMKFNINTEGTEADGAMKWGGGVEEYS